MDSVKVIDSKSDLWLSSIMRETYQELPPASIALTRMTNQSSLAEHHRLEFSCGAKDLKVMVNKVCLPPEAMKNGFDLQGGELVRIYSSHWLKFGIPVDEWAGPLSFQYRAAANAVDCKENIPTQKANNNLTLDQLPKAILRMIFAHLPVDEALYNIPAVCSKFLLAAREQMAFHQWELAGGCPTPREAAFCLAWASAGPISNLALTCLPLTSVKDWHSVSRFLEHDLDKNRSSIRCIECHLKTSPSPDNGKSEAEFEKIKESAIFRFVHFLEDFPAVESLKITGLPFLPLDATVFSKFFRLERLWLEFHGNVLYGLDALNAGPLVKNLKSVALAFSPPGDELKMTAEVDRFSINQVFPSKDSPGKDDSKEAACGIEELFAAFAPADDEEKERVLLLSAKAGDWRKLQALLSPLKRLDALSMAVDGHLVPSDVKMLINSIPTSVKALRILVEGFNDELCLAVGNRCQGLKVFACDGSDAVGVTESGVNQFLDKCQELEGLFILLRQEGDGFVPRFDALPRKFADQVKSYERRMRKIFA